MRDRALCIVLTALLSVTAASARAEDWPRWRGPRGDGTWNAPKLSEQWPAAGLRRVWRQAIGGGHAGVTVANGRVYTMDRPTKDADEERVLCFDAATGKPLWTHAYGARYGDMDHDNGPRAAPTVAAGRVYTLGAVGHVHCIDAGTGKVVWAKEMVREHQARVPKWGLAASPLIDGNRVIVHTGAEPDGCVMALDLWTGKEIWRSLPDSAGYATPVRIDSESGPQLIVWTPENVHGLDPETGKPYWSVPYKSRLGVSIATPILREGIVLVSGYWDGTKAIRLGPSPTDAKLIWEENRHLRGLMSQPLYRDGHVYLLDKREGLVCFELATGRKLWDDGNRMTPRDRNPQATMVWLGDADRAIILNAEGELILARLNPIGYQEQSRTKIIGRTWAHPAYAGTNVYARDDHELVCVSLVEEKP